ncbi:MAG: hypothetical protein K8S00_11100 [Bacteroidales bacterium]|nr:hypothetical protein [Bacteroidales bacterium]
MKNKAIALLFDFFNPIFQTLKDILLKHYCILVFLIIPIVFLLTTSTIHFHHSPFYQGSVDPEYFHLYNGITIAKGNPDVEYIAHPGTPLQYLIGISARLVYIFQPDEEFIQDFIDNPEKYIHAANLFMNILTAFILLICGIYTTKYTGSLILGLLIQLAPFGNSSVLSISGRLLPESIMIMPLLLFGLLIIRYIFVENKTNNNRSYIVLFGLITGFGIACKLSFIPVLLLSLILLNTSLKQKIKYLLYSILFFVIFAYPVIVNFSVFYEWVTGIFTHSGMHGAGDKSFINLTTVPGNFKYLFSFDKGFFYILIASSLLGILFLFKPFRNPDQINIKIIRAIFAINISIIVCIVFTLKHFALHYFMPFYIFKYILLILSALLIAHVHKQLPFKRYKGVVLSLFLILAVIISYVQALNLGDSLEGISKRKESLQQSYNSIIPLVNKDKPIIITGPYYGTPFIEYAQNEGFMTSYNRKGIFKPYLMKKFPNAYHYVSWSDKFYHWDDFVDFQYILNKTDGSFYVYIGRERANRLVEIEKRVWEILDRESVTRKVLFLNQETRETLIEFIVATN